jgi:Domain of unknown function (DUF4416)
MTGSGPEPRVKGFAALLYGADDALLSALERLAQALGPLEPPGAAHPFDVTDYYAAEMGKPLRRVLVPMARLVAPGWLVDAKHAAVAVEDGLRVDGRRRVNLDVGYLDLGKVVLASGKGRPSKLYLERGVWADLTLAYAGGRFQPLPWTFPDFRAGRYDAELHALRERYKAQLREGADAPLPPAR